MIFAKDLDPNKVALYIAIISAIAAVIGPVLLLLVSSLKRIRDLSERAVHNTQPNGVPDSEGNIGTPSSFDTLVNTHEYMIGQLHALEHIVLETRDIALDAKETTALNAQQISVNTERITEIKGAFSEHLVDVESRVIEATELATKIVTKVNGRLNALEAVSPPGPPSPGELPPGEPPTATTPPPAPEAGSE